MLQQERIAEGFNRLTQAINTLQESSRGFQEYTQDPLNPVEGEAWVLVSPDGYAAVGFFGAMPILYASGNSKYELSIKTSTGIKRIGIK